MDIDLEDFEKVSHETITHLTFNIGKTKVQNYSYPTNTFEKFPSLEYLNICDNIFIDTFYALKNLICLELRHCNMDEITCDLLKHIPLLEKLMLYRCTGSLILDGNKYPYLKNIKHIDINGICLYYKDKLNPNPIRLSIKNLKCLEKITMILKNDIKFKSIELDSLPNLKHLELKAEEYSINNVPNIEYLKIGYNLENTFTILPKFIKCIYLNNVEITDNFVYMLSDCKDLNIINLCDVQYSNRLTEYAKLNNILLVSL